MAAIKKVLCFGELLLRLSPTPGTTWIDNAKMPIYLGGAELNVSKGLTKWGMPVRYCTALPDNSVSAAIKAHLDETGIDTTAIQASGDRVGLYYMAQGADLKNAGVIYDRVNSSVACLQPGMLNWDEIMQDVEWLHFSAITPALSASVAAVCVEALQYASAKNITISVDLNYRAKLWKYGKTPVQVMPELVQYCDVVMGNVWAAQNMLGIAVDDELVSRNAQEHYLQQAEQTSIAIQQQYTKCKMVANTYRFSEEADGNINYYATLYADRQLLHSATYNAETVVDKSGSGDCFMAGLIYATRNGYSQRETIDFATAAAFSKLFIAGDATNMSVNEIKNKIKR